MQAHCAMSLFRLGQHLEHHGIKGAAATVSFPDIADVRNIFLTLWYDQSDATHILFIDSDMDFESRLVIDMIEFDQPLVGAIYPAKVLPTKFVGRAGPTAQAEVINRGFMLVEGVGAGIMLIKRECITKMLEADPSIASDKGLDEQPGAEHIDGRAV